MAVTFSKWKTPIKEQDPEVRRSNFKEVCLGYSVEEGIKESNAASSARRSRALKDAPWRSTSPLSSNASKRETCAEQPKSSTNIRTLPAVCGRACARRRRSVEELCTVGKMHGFEPVAIENSSAWWQTGSTHRKRRIPKKTTGTDQGQGSRGRFRSLRSSPLPEILQRWATKSPSLRRSMRPAESSSTGSPNSVFRRA